jgi:hypothetical protein
MARPFRTLKNYLFWALLHFTHQSKFECLHRIVNRVREPHLKVSDLLVPNALGRRLGLPTYGRYFEG